MDGCRRIWIVQIRVDRVLGKTEARKLGESREGGGSRQELKGGVVSKYNKNTLHEI